MLDSHWSIRETFFFTQQCKINCDWSLPNDKNNVSMREMELFHPIKLRVAFEELDKMEKIKTNVGKCVLCLVYVRYVGSK